VLDEPADEVRKQELDRIDRLQVAVWNRALKGDDKAINTVLRLMERRARLLGLDAAQRVQAEVVSYDGHRDIDGEIRNSTQGSSWKDSNERYSNLQSYFQTQPFIFLGV
jgi:hypothetical protein